MASWSVCLRVCIMNGCEAIRKLLIAHHDGEVGNEERRLVEAHLATCPGCAREADLIREALRRVQGFPVPDPPEGFWEDFGAAVSQRIAAEPPPHPSFWTRVASWLPLWPRLRPVPALAMATALGLLLAIGIVRTYRTPRDVPPVEAFVVSEDLGIAQDLEVLENLDLLQEVEVLERLDLLRRMDGRRPRLS